MPIDKPISKRREPTLLTCVSVVNSFGFGEDATSSLIVGVVGGGIRMRCGHSGTHILVAFANQFC